MSRGVVWMSEDFLTYEQLAQRLNIKPASAKRLVQRKKWARIIGNDGVTRVKVEGVAVTPIVTDDVGGDVAPDMSSPLVAEIERLRAELEAERARSDQAIADLRADRDVEIERLQAAHKRELEGLRADRDEWRTTATKSLWAKIFG